MTTTRPPRAFTLKRRQQKRGRNDTLLVRLTNWAALPRTHDSVEAAFLTLEDGVVLCELVAQLSGKRVRTKTGPWKSHGFRAAAARENFRSFTTACVKRFKFNKAASET